MALTSLAAVLYMVQLRGEKKRGLITKGSHSRKSGNSLPGWKAFTALTWSFFMEGD